MPDREVFIVFFGTEDERNNAIAAMKVSDTKIHFIGNISMPGEEAVEKPALITEGDRATAKFFKELKGVSALLKPTGREMPTGSGCLYEIGKSCPEPNGCKGAVSFAWRCHYADPP